MSGGGFEAEEEMGSGCSTPKRWECQIHTALGPPPPPKKKPFSFGRRKKEAPKNGYFQPPEDDLEHLFYILPPSHTSKYYN